MAIAAVLALFALLAGVWIYRHNHPDHALDRPASSSGAPSEAPRAIEPPRAIVTAALAPPTRTVRDRATRDAVRAEIYRTWSAANGASAPAGQARGPDPVTAPMPSQPSVVPITPDYIRQRIREDFLPMARACYEQLLHRVPGSRGVARMRFRLVGSEGVGGVIDEANMLAPDGGAAMGDAEFTTCMTESMMTMAFVPPPSGTSLEVTYPFRLEPDAPDAGG